MAAVVSRKPFRFRDVSFPSQSKLMNGAWHIDLKEYGGSLKHPSTEVERPSKERYEFVDCSDGRRPNDPNTRKVVRTHVMHNYPRQKQIAAHAKPGLQVVGVERQDNDAETIVGLERPLVLSPERWSKDSFDYLCKSTAPHLSSH
jgi:hypothetical protein